MEFIVLTYDDRISFTELMVKSYCALCSNITNISFRIPYNNDKTLDYINTFPGKIIPIKCNKAMKPTMRALLEGMSDDSFVYWCSDDRYINQFTNRQIFKQLINVLSQQQSNIEAVRILTIPAQQNKKITTLLNNQITLYKFSDAVVHGFWNHHFIKKHCLENIFINNNLPENYSLRQLHILLSENNKKYDHNIYTVTNSICVLGETTYHDKMTANCLTAMRQYNINIPAYPKENITIFFDGSPHLVRI
jgi:hypothetical protein